MHPRRRSQYFLQFSHRLPLPNAPLYCLAHLRKLKKVNQREAAAALGVSQALLSHYEKGLREPGMEFLLNAADYYGVSADWLLGRTSDMTGTFLGAGADSAATTEADPSRRAAARRRADKARMQESVGMVYDLLEKLDARELEPAVHAHLSAELVQILSLIHLSAGAADFSRMAEYALDMDLHIGSILQKTVLKVNETGTEAAAATQVAMLARGAYISETAVMNVDKPFMMLIHDPASGCVLFASLINNPA